LRIAGAIEVNRRYRLSVGRSALSVGRLFVDQLGLPHQPPFVFVREITSCDPGRKAECLTTFDADDPMFRGHFPGNPLVPGVILTEALAQTAGIAAASGHPAERRPFFLLSAIRQMKFLHAVRPNEQIILRAEKTGEMSELLQFRVAAKVNDKIVAEGELVLVRTPPLASPKDAQ
jgi:3-hydroxyacyl-[acyl-carrier-protein] dehydratase